MTYVRVKRPKLRLPVRRFYQQLPFGPVHLLRLLANVAPLLGDYPLWPFLSSQCQEAEPDEQHLSCNVPNRGAVSPEPGGSRNLEAVPLVADSCRSRRATPRSWPASIAGITWYKGTRGSCRSDTYWRAHCHRRVRPPRPGCVPTVDRVPLDESYDGVKELSGGGEHATN